MTQSTLNTFSKEMAEEYLTNEKFGCPAIVAVEKVRVIPVNTILEKYFSGENNYFISIDIEGWDFEVLSTIDFTRYRPKVICIETNKLVRKDVDKYISLLQDVDYLLYADTAINSIFLDRNYSHF